MIFELWSNTQLCDSIDSLMERSERDEALRAEPTAQFQNIYDTLSDPSLREYFEALAPRSISTLRLPIARSSGQSFSMRLCTSTETG
jgi:hypothetical protein